MERNTKSRMPQIGEAIFCIAYLVFDLIAAVIFFVGAKGSQAILLFGVLTLVLGGGDAFHLVPSGRKPEMGNLSQSSVRRDRPVSYDPVLPVGKYRRIRSVADVCRYPHQLCLLLSRGAVGEEKARGRNADDAQNRGLYLDDLHGAQPDRQGKYPVAGCGLNLYLLCNF